MRVHHIAKKREEFYSSEVFVSSDEINPKSWTSYKVLVRQSSPICNRTRVTVPCFCLAICVTIKWWLEKAVTSYDLAFNFLLTEQSFHYKKC